MKITALLTFAIALLLSGCNEYKAQLCNERNQVDVPGLEGNYAAISQNADNFTTQKAMVQIKKVATGSYELVSGRSKQMISTCTIGERTLLEGQNAKTKTYTSYFLKPADGGFDLTFSFFDKPALDRAGIPSQIVDRGESSSSFGGRTKALVVDNTNQDPETMVKLLSPTSVSFRLFHQ